MKQKDTSRLVTAKALLALVGFVAGCSVSHPAMRGSIITMADNEAHICIGTYDGLTVGNTLAVYRTRQVGRSHLPYGPYRSPGEIQRSFQYEKVRVGNVKVTRILMNISPLSKV